jgi:hypothetical protein
MGAQDHDGQGRRGDADRLGDGRDRTGIAASPGGARDEVRGSVAESGQESQENAHVGPYLLTQANAQIR